MASLKIDFSSCVLDTGADQTSYNIINTAIHATASPEDKEIHIIHFVDITFTSTHLNQKAHTTRCTQNLYNTINPNRIHQTSALNSKNCLNQKIKFLPKLSSSPKDQSATHRSGPQIRATAPQPWELAKYSIRGTKQNSNRARCRLLLHGNLNAREIVADVQTKR